MAGVQKYDYLNVMTEGFLRMVRAGVLDQERDVCASVAIKVATNDVRCRAEVTRELFHFFADLANSPVWIGAIQSCAYGRGNGLLRLHGCREDQGSQDGEGDAHGS